MRPRDLALAVLNSLENSYRFPKRFLEDAFQQASHLKERDRAFTIHLVQGVLRWRLRLDWMVQNSVRFPFKKIEPPVLNILRIALYQIYFMDRVPESAAVNEAVKQAKAIKPDRVAGFVNGILRNICRNKKQFEFPDSKEDPVGYLSVFYSYPTWLVEKWIREIGIDSAEHMLLAGNCIPKLVVRTNTLRIDRPSLIKCLEREGVEAKPTSYAPEGVLLTNFKGPVDQLKSFGEGLFQVQSEAAQVSVQLLSPKPGERILDICAGLGGKSTHMAQLMGAEGEVLALDMNHYRLLALAQSSYRLGTGNIWSVVADAASQSLPMVDSSFDKILVDGPCSALGTISRHPDAKWIRSERDIKRLSFLQRHILNNAVPVLHKGGKMLYVTCTISREENEEVVSDFLERNREMTLENLKDFVPEWGLDLIEDHGFFKPFPHLHGMDGFFGALFTKVDG